jgi:hypothetical protein
MNRKITFAISAPVDPDFQSEALYNRDCFKFFLVSGWAIAATSLAEA